MIKYLCISFLSLFIANTIFGNLQEAVKEGSVDEVINILKNKQINLDRRRAAKELATSIRDAIRFARFHLIPIIDPQTNQTVEIYNLLLNEVEYNKIIELLSEEPRLEEC